MSKENKTKKIFRQVKDESYCVIKNDVFLDKRISWGAKGVLGYALTKPDDWDLYISEVTKNGSDKIDKVTKYFKELRLAGYIEYVITRERGKITKTEYLVYEKPLHLNPINMITRHQIRKAKKLNKEKPELESPRQEKPQMEKPFVEKPSLINTDSLLNTDNNKILKENEKKVMLPLEEENKLSLSNLKTKFIETLKANGLEYNPGVKDSRFNYFSLNENNITPQELIDLIPKLIHVKKDNPTDKFFNGICWNMSDLISYKAKINNAYKPKIREFKKPEIKSEPVKFSESHLDTLKEFLA